MNYTERQRAPARVLAGAGIVLVMHLLLGWALVTSLARKVIDVIKAPVETRVIDRKSTRLNSSHIQKSRMPSSA